MVRYVAKRFAQSVAALFVLLTVVFFLTRLTGDPTDLYLPLSASEAQRAEFRQENGFDDPVVIQFFRYISNLAQGDFGDSVFKARPALDVVLEAFPVTLKLAALAMSIAICLAAILGSLAAYRPNSLFDRLVSFLTIVTASIPPFWISIVAILVFSMQFGWLPTSGIGGVRNWIMPVGVLVLSPVGLLAQVVRTGMLSCLNAPYVKTAISKGASTPRIIFVHALRNALLPLITVAGIQATSLINGAVVVETIFGFPGIGNLMIESVRNRDFELTITCIIVTAIAVYVMNTIIDILYMRLDPRVRLA